jgi:phage terminase large subunit-like protein
MPKRPPSPIERERAAQAAALASIEQMVPGIVGNPYVPSWPTAPQMLALRAYQFASSPGVHQLLYGGSVGGGKSEWLLMAAAQFAHDPQFAGLILRRTYQELAKPGAIMDRALSWWKPKGVHWDGQTRTFTFPTGARITFGYMQNEHDHLQYQGSEYQFTGWDEITQFPRESQYEFVALSRMRRKDGSQTPVRSYSTSNPGGPGHSWVKAKFIGEEGKPAPYLYIPARLRDNPHIDQESYMEGLKHLHPTTRQQLLEGDWSAREPGDYFRSEWFGPLLSERWPSASCIRVRWWDLAASESKDAARTAGVLMARSVHGVRAIEHAVAFRATPGTRDDRIVQTAQADGHAVTVGIEIEPGSGGIAQFEALAKRLRALGYRVAGARPRAGIEQSEAVKALVTRQPSTEGGKAGRADPVASCLERGYQRRGQGGPPDSPIFGADQHLSDIEHRDGLRLHAGPWTQAYLDEVLGFPDGGLCDLVDATSGAWAWLETRGLPARAPDPRRQKTRAEVQNLHPDDRPEPDARSMR